ncbi:hypothetical protein [Dyella japonica]|jgi:hypothetical protein|uniref:Uncharacterized protein n=1 Tax=Dyella japonica DSM 16301 TaxID=1440762 RepID=A0A0G9HF30_9GAMM|nr:hypothetical protein [Dyella japonica]KLD66237.1 hypothetical protein Y882_00800 [Dyella japonica DSM 16301]
MKGRRLVQTSLVLCALALSQIASAAALECTMRFSLSGWSVIYKHTSGQGVVTCTDGQTMKVKIESHGGGLTAGKSRIDNGIGNFSDIKKISDVLGTYAQADASAGAVKSGTAQVLTKGEVSLALSGAGQGIDLGVSIGGLTISEDK